MSLDSILQEFELELNNLSNLISTTKKLQYFAGPYDKNDCMMSLQAGAGGIESQDWVQMLLRMYQKYFDTNKFRYTIEDITYGDYGVKNVDMRVAGLMSFGLLSGEKGTHRLVRNSPFNAQGKRQTSFAAVDVWPLVEDESGNEENVFSSSVSYVSVEPLPVIY